MEPKRGGGDSKLNQEDFLYHHGVKGMKWGHRKDKRGGLPSKRKLKKMIKNANKTPENNKNYIAISKKATNELLKSKEGKAYSNLITNMAKLEKDARAQGGHIAYTTEQAKGIKQIQDNFVKRGETISKKYQNEFASAMIKDLGLKDTQAGRDYLKKHKFV